MPGASLCAAAYMLLSFGEVLFSISRSPMPIVISFRLAGLATLPKLSLKLGLSE
jgi:hypothetical protein